MLGWELPPYNTGGLGVACYQLCKTLSKRNVEIEFVLPYRTLEPVNFMRITPSYPREVLEVIRTDSVYDSYLYTSEDSHQELLGIVDQQELFEKTVDKLVEIRQFDIIHAHDWLTFRAALRIKIKTGWPLVAHIHSIEFDRAAGMSGNPFVREIEARGLAIADQAIAVSKRTKNHIISEYSIPADKIHVIYNGIDREEMIPLDEENVYKYIKAAHAQGFCVVAALSRLTIQKGLANLLKAAKEVVNHLPKTLFLIVGSGDQYHELIELAAELGIARNVIFTGFLRGTQWRDAFAIADLFVMPSVSEPFGLTPLEAIYYRTPSLISYQSGVGEVLHNCLKVDFWDTDEMVNKIVGTLRSRELRDSLRDNAAAELEHLNWDQSVDELLGLYQKLLKSSAS